MPFSRQTKEQALRRQGYHCACCGAMIYGICGTYRTAFGEGVHAHHIRHAKKKGPDSLDNCAVICWSCHYSAHEGGNYRYGRVQGSKEDFTFEGEPIPRFRDSR